VHPNDVDGTFVAWMREAYAVDDSLVDHRPTRPFTAPARVAAATLALRPARLVGLHVRLIDALLVSFAAPVRSVRFLIRTVLVRAPFRHGSLAEMRGSTDAHTPYPH
jgi:hypothetical protein